MPYRPDFTAETAFVFGPYFGPTCIIGRAALYIRRKEKTVTWLFKLIGLETRTMKMDRWQRLSRQSLQSYVN